MRISLVITNEAKQVMLTPETKYEEEALSYIGPGDRLETVVKKGSFYDRDKYRHAELEISECRGGYLRAFSSENSLMFVIKNKEGKEVSE